MRKTKVTTQQQTEDPRIVEAVRNADPLTGMPNTTEWEMAIIRAIPQMLAAPRWQRLDELVIDMVAAAEDLECDMDRYRRALAGGQESILQAADAGEILKGMVEIQAGLDANRKQYEEAVKPLRELWAAIERLGDEGPEKGTKARRHEGKKGGKARSDEATKGRSDQGEVCEIPAPGGAKLGVTIKEIDGRWYAGFHRQVRGSGVLSFPLADPRTDHGDDSRVECLLAVGNRMSAHLGHTLSRVEAKPLIAAVRKWQRQVRQGKLPAPGTQHPAPSTSDPQPSTLNPPAKRHRQAGRKRKRTEAEALDAMLDDIEAAGGKTGAPDPAPSTQHPEPSTEHPAPRRQSYSQWLSNLRATVQRRGDALTLPAAAAGESPLEPWVAPGPSRGLRVLVLGERRERGWGGGSPPGVVVWCCA